MIRKEMKEKKKKKKNDTETKKEIEQNKSSLSFGRTQAGIRCCFLGEVQSLKIVIYSRILESSAVFKF